MAHACIHSSVFWYGLLPLQETGRVACECGMCACRICISLFVGELLVRPLSQESQHECLGDVQDVPGRGVDDDLHVLDADQLAKGLDDTVSHDPVALRLLFHKQLRATEIGEEIVVNCTGKMETYQVNKKWRR